MATWTIRVNAQSGQGDGASGTHATTLAQALPGDFDGAIITNIALSGAGSTTVSGASDDTVGVRFIIETSTGTDIYGGVGSDAASLAFAAASTSSSSIGLGSSPSPAPTTAVAADWDNVQWSVVYNRSGKADGATIAWGQFDIVVTYVSPLTAEPPSGSVSTASDAPTVTKTNFKVITPGTAAVTTEGQTPFRAYGLVTASEAPTVTIDAGTGTSITPASGSVSAVGQNLTLDTGIAVGSWSVAATGNAPTLDTSIAIPERTNLLKQSQTFDVANWNVTNAALNPNVTTAPDGTLTAERLIDTAGGGSGICQTFQGSVTVPSAGSYVFSCYLKADQLSWALLQNSAFDTGGNSWFDLSGGVIGTTSANHDDHQIVDVGNGWYRCWFAFTTTTDLVGTFAIRPCEANNQATTTLDGTSSIFIWGAQVEAGVKPSSYLPTTTAAVSDANRLVSWSEAPTVSFGRTIEVPVGSATIAGQTPTIGIVIQVPSGTVVTQGQDIAVSIGEVIPVPVATVVLEGQSVDVIEGNIRAPPTGALVAVGQSPALDTGILVDSGSASITGNAITLDVAVSVPSGSVATASEAPTPSIVEGGKSITPDSASVSISGQSFTLDTSILVDSGAVTVTGQPITLSGQFLAQPGSGSVVTASDAPTLGLSIAVPSGSVVTQGNVPTLGTTIPITGTAVTVSGQNLTLDTSVLVGSGSAVTASQAPTLVRSGSILIPTVDVTTSGQSLTLGLSVAVPSGAVTTQGYAPTVTITAPAVEAPRKTGGRAKGRKRYYVVEIDGEDFIVNTVAEAQYLLMQAREMAGQVAEKAVQSTPTPPRVAIKTAKGKATTSKTLQKEVRRTQQAINAIYRRAAESVARTEEIARLMHERLREEDEEDAITALLLS